MTSASPPTVAWFRVEHDSSRLMDEVPALHDELSSRMAIDVFSEARAHDFVWMHAQRPYDVCVYELDDTPAHQFIWAYLLNYPGVVWLRSGTVHRSRALALERQGRLRDAHAEAAFNLGGPAPEELAAFPSSMYSSAALIRLPLDASKLIVVQHASTKSTLGLDYPDARIRQLPLGVSPLDMPRPFEASGVASPPEGLVVGVIGSSCPATLERAMRRAVAAGAAARLIHGAADAVIPQADVIAVLDWPATERVAVTALVALAHAKAVVVFEVEPIADWPALDPQTWRARGIDGSPPIVVSIDPRDEEHSLVLAIRRLAADPALCARLGAAGHAWWRTRGNVTHAAEAWTRVLHEARDLPAPPRPADWPQHLQEDGTGLARRILREFGLALDF